MITTTIYPFPMIQQTFNPLLLMTTLQRKKHLVESKIKPLAIKKIKPAHVGRHKDFYYLLFLFEQEYERKVKEEENYKAEVKIKVEERPYIPTSAGIIRFKRV